MGSARVEVAARLDEAEIAQCQLVKYRCLLGDVLVFRDTRTSPFLP